MLKHKAEEKTRDKSNSVLQIVDWDNEGSSSEESEEEGESS